MTWQPGEHIASPREAEECAAWHLRQIGFADAKVTAASGDGGVDVRGSQVLAEVKQIAAVVGRPLLQRLAGASERQDVALAYYSASGYSVAGQEYADRMGMALFIYSVRGEVTPVNGHARALVERIRAEEPAAPSSSSTGGTFRAAFRDAAEASRAERERLQGLSPEERRRETAESMRQLANWLEKALLVIGVVGVIGAVGISCQAVAGTNPDAELIVATLPLGLAVGSFALLWLIRRVRRVRLLRHIRRGKQ
ncbi:restriction endonuclease [Cellulosimicrobium sp. NPDC057127]|uniref:restriction endonuclease n=1 Tax=Cellulosimicrobium sp. NPDC057127 TaxID=3346026 RepID=UPI00363E0E5C